MHEPVSNIHSSFQSERVKTNKIKQELFFTRSASFNLSITARLRRRKVISKDLSFPYNLKKANLNGRLKWVCAEMKPFDLSRVTYKLLQLATYMQQNFHEILGVNFGGWEGYQWKFTRSICPSARWLESSQGPFLGSICFFYGEIRSNLRSFHLHEFCWMKLMNAAEHVKIKNVTYCLQAITKHILPANDWTGTIQKQNQSVHTFWEKQMLVYRCRL